MKYALPLLFGMNATVSCFASPLPPAVEVGADGFSL